MAKIQGNSASYAFTGKELYVRAVVRSDKRISNAPAGGVQLQAAWCQPVGWKNWGENVSQLFSAAGTAYVTLNNRAGPPQNRWNGAAGSDRRTTEYVFGRGVGGGGKRLTPDLGVVRGWRKNLH